MNDPLVYRVANTSREATTTSGVPSLPVPRRMVTCVTVIIAFHA